jgi:hypothetical protein
MKIEWAVSDPVRSVIVLAMSLLLR